jgi:ubiquinone biosynthesis monooxygenase Coq7
MDIEELHHRELALASGGAALSPPVRQTMRWMANRMKATAYHL